MNENNDQTKDISSAVMEQIQTEHIKIRPRIYFILGALLGILGLTITIIICVLFVEITLFRLRAHGPLGYLWFGPYGIRAFIETFPILPVGLSVLTLILGILIIRRYDMSYKTSFKGIILILLIAIGLSGLVLDRIGVHQQIARFEPLRTVVIPELTEQGWVMGEIVTIDPQNAQMEIIAPDDTAITVAWTAATMLPFGVNFDPGQRIRAVGEWEGEIFVAQGIGIGGLQYRPGEFPTPRVRMYRMQPN